MKDALATLKTASGGKGDFLYDLPWYRPDRSSRIGQNHRAGQFRPEIPAVQRSDAGGDRRRRRHALLRLVVYRRRGADRHRRPLHHPGFRRQSDKQSWLAFLDLLKKNRPRQPINGVMVAISLEDLMTLSPAEIKAHADAIRARLLELHERLKVDFPVYAVFTKSDLIAGFMEYFANLSDQGRRQVWGATFQTDDKTRNMVGEVPVEFDALVERLNSDLTDRLQEEPTPSSRVLLYGFPASGRRAEAADLRFPQSDIRADPLSRQRDAARLLPHLRHPAWHADRPADRRAGKELRRRTGWRPGLFRTRQELLPRRPDPEGDHRRSRLGFHRPCRAAARADHQGHSLHGCSH